MRRLRSSFTLLSTDESPPHPSESEDAYDHRQGPSASEPLHFTWDELFAGDPPDPTPYYQASPYPEYPFDGPPLFSSSPKYPGDGEDYLQETTAEEEEEILPSDSEHSYSGGPLPSLSERNQHPSITPYGTVSVLMRHLVRVDVSPGGAVMLCNYRSGSTAVVGASGRSCINHANARVYQDGPEVHVMTCQGRLAKICQRGVVFTASARSLAYLVDESGTKSTADRFVDLRRDFSFDVFNDQSQLGPSSSCGDCFELLANSAYKPLPNGDDVWRIGGAAVKQDRYGNVEVAQERRRRVLTLLPTVDELSLMADGFSATVGSYSKRYLTAQAASRRITAGYCGLTAKSGSQKAGIDRNGKVAIL